MGHTKEKGSRDVQVHKRGDYHKSYPTNQATQKDSMRSIKDIFRSYAVFDNEGRHVNGTDKQSNHNYGDAYEGILTYQRPQDDPGSIVHSKYPYSIRNDVKLVMEVGVADGSCLLAWREVFPNATIVGLDIHEPARITQEFINQGGKLDRIQVYLGNQQYQADCELAAAGRQFDLIIEDATHILQDSLLTFLYLWPFVKPGGMYVIEEFANVGVLRENIKALWSYAQVIDTTGPTGGIEPLVVFRKPL